MLCIQFPLDGLGPGDYDDMADSYPIQIHVQTT